LINLKIYKNLVIIILLNIKIELNISKNQVEDYPDDILTLKYLRKVDCSYNLIKEIWVYP
jgi:Leucine-rich repeat (LRR) protein